MGFESRRIEVVDSNFERAWREATVVDHNSGHWTGVMDLLQANPWLWIILAPILFLLLLLLLVPSMARRSRDKGWSGFSYSNHNDPALLVPKRFGIGYTLNFGNPLSWVVLVLLLVLAGAPLFYAASRLRQLSSLPATNLLALPIPWIVVGLAAPYLLIGTINFVLLAIAQPLQSPPSAGLRGIFSPHRVSMFWWFSWLTPYSLNFTNPWAWVYLAVVGLLVLEPFFLGTFLIRHLLANLIN